MTTGSGGSEMTEWVEDDTTSETLDRGATTYIAGHRGMVGSAIWRRFEADGFTGLVGRSSAELDLTDRAGVFAFFEQTRPRTVVLAAAKVGGIFANMTYPSGFLSTNLRIQTNVGPWPPVVDTGFVFTRPLAA